ncbi:hypothetical protein LX32DRAFT_127989 [Colletotrichum zoysiae]|uniref:Uncharacterized protein n=1 Tax=Colletotrichum zoysiae TaxID=1216348 RepID=A0AAD9M8R8_9PEZI|nr:hypothetical protein LX32DRAFT_127989 [Colletotrichum zoysiae]
MRCSLVFLLAPVTVLALGIGSILGAGSLGRRPSRPTIARPVTGPLCCGQGVADPTNTCSGKGLNSFCVSFLFILFIFSLQFYSGRGEQEKEEGKAKPKADEYLYSARIGGTMLEPVATMWQDFQSDARFWPLRLVILFVMGLDSSDAPNDNDSPSEVCWYDTIRTCAKGHSLPFR